MKRCDFSGLGGHSGDGVARRPGPGTVERDGDGDDGKAGHHDLPAGTHGVTDEASGAFYDVLSSDVVDLDAYTGQRVTIYGTLVPGYEYGQVEGSPPLVDVTWVEPLPL
jgi:hypothetical protein